MATRIPTGVRNAAADAAAGRVDAGSGAGVIRLYSGSQPSSANDAATGDLLAEVDCADPAYDAASSGSAELAGTPRSDEGTAAAGSGTDAGWARIVDSDGNAVVDGSVSGTGSGGDIELDNVNIAEGQTVNITGHTITMPSGE